MGDGGEGAFGPEPAWRGERVRLRLVSVDDWPWFHRWNHDVDWWMADDFGVYPPSREADVKAWLERDQAAISQRDDSRRFIIENLEGEPAGTINTAKCNQQSGTFTYGIAVGGDHRRKGYASEPILLVLRYYFLERRYQKVTTSVWSVNEASLGLHRSLGFAEEGCMRRMIFAHGRYHDEHRFGMTVEEFVEMHASRLPPYHVS